MYSIFYFLSQLINLVLVLLVIRIILTWVVPDYYKWQQQPLRTLQAVTEPIMAPFRALVPPIGGIDFSPMLLFLLLQLLQGFLMTLASRTGL